MVLTIIKDKLWAQCDHTMLEPYNTRVECGPIWTIIFFLPTLLSQDKLCEQGVYISLKVEIVLNPLSCINIFSSNLYYFYLLSVFTTDNHPSIDFSITRSQTLRRSLHSKLNLCLTLFP